MQGQLGNGTTTNSATPVEATGLPAMANAIATGGYFTLAVLSNGTAWAWGSNDSGHLGNGSTTDSVTPVHVQGLSGVIVIAGGVYHALAVRSEGTESVAAALEAASVGLGVSAVASVIARGVDVREGSCLGAAASFACAFLGSMDVAEVGNFRQGLSDAEQFVDPGETLSGLEFYNQARDAEQLSFGLGLGTDVSLILGVGFDSSFINVEAWCL